MSGDRKDQGRDDREDEGGGDLAVLDAGGRDEGECADGDRLLVGRSEDQGEDEIVPSEDESQQRGCSDARERKRNCDLQKRRQPAMTVDAVGMLDVLADVLKIAAGDPEDERAA